LNHLNIIFFVTNRTFRLSSLKQQDQKTKISLTKLEKESYQDYHLLQTIHDQTLNLRKRIQNEKIFLQSNIIAKGLEYYRFLMDCLPPASIPGMF
jgi:hypothetical protein